MIIPSVIDIESTLRNEAGNLSDVSLMVLFGSAAAGRMRADSDVDVAVAGNAPFSWDRQQEIRIALSRKLRREADVVDLNVVKGLIMYQILTKGKIIVSTDKRLMARLMTDVVYFAADMLPMMQMLFERRARRFIDG